MIEAFCTRTVDNMLQPATEHDAELIGAIAYGKAVRVKITQVRNLAFHRKGFVLLHVAFDLWCEHIEPVQYEGVDVKPDFETFREKLTIQAGFYTVAFDLRGKVTFKAESLSFASMSEERFAKVYSAYIDTILDQLLAGIIERDELEAAVERIIGFA